MPSRELWPRGPAEASSPGEIVRIYAAPLKPVNGSAMFDSNRRFVAVMFC